MVKRIGLEMNVPMNNSDNSSKVFFNKDLILLDIKAQDYKEVLSQLSQRFLENGYVKETYSNALIEREKTFPTGLKTNEFAVAIPHADPAHVKYGSLGIGTLKTPVTFRAMDTGAELQVSVLFMLAITNSSSQLKMLQKVIELIQNDKVLMNIKQSKNKEEIINLIEPFFGDLI